MIKRLKSKKLVISSIIIFSILMSVVADGVITKLYKNGNGIVLNMSNGEETMTNLSLSALTVINLKTVDMVNPLGIDKTPWFSWVMNSNAIGQKQTAYQIMVAMTPEQLAAENYYWDSGKVISEESVQVAYGGTALQARTRYYWQIRVWDKDGIDALSTEEAWFETGLNEANPLSDAAFLVRDTSSDMLPNSFSTEVDMKINSNDGGIILCSNGFENTVFFLFDATDTNVKIRPFLCKTGYVYTELSGYTLAAMPKSSIVGQTIHIKLDVVSGVVKTYINGTYIYAVNLGSYGISLSNYYVGSPGFRGISSITPNVDYDNLKQTVNGTVVFEEDFSNSDSISVKSNSGSLSVVDGALRVTSPSSIIIAEVQTDYTRPAPMFRREFSTSGREVESARLYATAGGLYEVFINGQRVGDSYLNPGRTSVNSRLMYQTYDITNYLSSGSNAIGVVVSEGWWTGTSLGFIGKLVISYTDGQSETIVTDSNWKFYGDGAVRTASIFNGEKYDARKEQDGWSEPGFNAVALGWNTPMTKTVQQMLTGEIVAQEGPLTKNTDTLSPVSVTEVEPGVFVYDFGQNIAGICRIKVTGTAGQIVTMRHGEKVNEANQRNRTSVPGVIWTTNLRTAQATDTYVMKGDSDGELFEPSLTYHGFQYMQLTGLSQPIPIDDVKALVISSEIQETGSFECSNPSVNKLVSNTRWSQIDNFLSIPTDCPQRDERLGWVGDAQIFARTGSYLFDINTFMFKFMQDIKDRQLNGVFPSGTEWQISSAAGGWSDGGVIIPWQMYLQYGDVSFINDNYSAMKNYVNKIISDCNGYIDKKGVKMDTMFGDWMGLEQTPIVITETAFCAYSTSLLAKMAAIIGNTSDATFYQNEFENFKTAWNQEFVNSDGSTKCDATKYGTDEWGNMTNPTTGVVDTQCSYILGLLFDLFTPQTRSLSAARLAQCIEKSGYTVQTGFLGVSYVAPVLTEMGYSDVAYRMLEQVGYPGWLYSVINGANTIYERWNGYEGFDDNTFNYNGSLNHYSYGSITEWLFRYVSGIETDENTAGYKKIILQPTLGGSFNSVNGSYNSNYGTIVSDWVANDGEMSYYKCVVPPNTTATLYLPVESDDNINTIAGVTFKGMTTHFGESVAEFDLLAGAYDFTVTSGNLDISYPDIPVIKTVSISNGFVGKAYYQKLTAESVASITWSMDSGSLPNGLMLSENGVISGTPTNVGVFNFTAKVTNGTESDTKTFTVEIYALSDIERIEMILLKKETSESYPEADFNFDGKVDIIDYLELNLFLLASESVK